MSNDYSIEQQRLIISALISNKQLFARCQSILVPNYWNKQFVKSVRFILEFSEKYKSLPSVEQIHAEAGVKFEILDSMTPEHEEYFLDEIEKFCRHQALTNAILKGSELLEKGEYGSIETLVKDALLVGLNKSLGTEYFKNPRERLLQLKDSNGKLSTGWLTLDQKLYNVNRAELLIFCAPSGGGKSVALQNLAVNMALQAYHCVYFTLELSESLCAMRVDCMLTGIKSTEIFKRIDDVELKVVTTGKQAGSITFKKLPSGVSTRELRTYLKEYQIQNGYKPDVILVDYLDLMMPNNKRISPENLFVKDKFIAEELRNLGEEQNALVATASQLGRSSVESQEFNHAHIAGGISKINTADNVIGIFNSQRARERGEIEFQLMKTRNSGSVDQKLTLAYDIDCLRISDLSDSGNDHKPYGTSAIMDRIKRSVPSNTTQKRNNPSQENENMEAVLDPINKEVIAPAESPMDRAARLSKLMNKNKR